MDGISTYLEDFAKKRGLEHTRDDLNNVFIRVPATKGYEDSPSVMLQGHMDMVCEKTSQSRHDFKKDAIDLDHMGSLPGERLSEPMTASRWLISWHS